MNNTCEEYIASRLNSDVVCTGSGSHVTDHCTWNASWASYITENLYRLSNSLSTAKYRTIGDLHLLWHSWCESLTMTITYTVYCISVAAL